MKDLVSHSVSFQIQQQEHDELVAYFEQDSLRYSNLSIFDLEETEYYVGDSPISDTISGYVYFQLTENRFVKSRCPYEIKLHTNLMRNKESLEVYGYVDHLLETLNFALQNAVPVHFDIHNKLEKIGWHMTCR